MTPMIQRSVCNVLACLTLLFCFGSSALHVAGQSYTVLSKRPSVIRVYDPDKDESTISALFLDPQNSDIRSIWALDPDRPLPEIQLHSAQYRYPGKIQSRPQVIAFVFLPLNKSKNVPNFSVTADGALIQEGQATFDELCCEMVSGPRNTQQRIIVAVPVDSFERVTQAKKVELKLASKSGKYSFKLNDYQKKCLVALANTIKP